MSYLVNDGKHEVITVDGVGYRRLCIRTHVITDQDNIFDVVEKYVTPSLQPGDIIFITEKAVACTQRRAIPIDQIHPRPLARFLSKFVLKTPYGIGLAMPETMEMALQECGTIRILFAAAVSAVGKLFGIRGWFYNIAGYKARSIDGPCSFTLPPYNHYVVLGPDRPDEVAAEISRRIGGTPVRILKNPMAREYVAREKAGADKLELEEFTLGSLRRAVFDGDVDNGSLMAGQIAGMVREIRPLRAIFEDLEAGYCARLAALAGEGR